jgi:hypothetical protein
MPTFFIVAICIVVAFGALLLLLAYLGVKSGKIKPSRGSGIEGGSGGSDASMNL